MQEEKTDMLAEFADSIRLLMENISWSGPDAMRLRADRKACALMAHHFGKTCLEAARKQVEAFGEQIGPLTCPTEEQTASMSAAMSFLCGGMMTSRLFSLSDPDAVYVLSLKISRSTVAPLASCLNEFPLRALKCRTPGPPQDVYDRVAELLLREYRDSWHERWILHGGCIRQGEDLPLVHMVGDGHRALAELAAMSTLYGDSPKADAAAILKCGYEMGFPVIGCEGRTAIILMA